MVSDNTYSFVSGFFHSTWWLWDSSTFLCVSASHSFILMRIISLYKHAMFVNPAICWWILGISRFGYWKERCNKISCISLPVYIFLFFLCKYLGIKWLHYLVSVYLTLINQEVFFLSSVQISSVSQSCLTLCDPMNSSTPGIPVHYQLPESTQTHVYRVGDVIQPSHPLSSPSPPALNPSWHQGLFKWVSSSHQVAKVLEFLSASTSVLPMNTQNWSPLGWTGWISLQSRGLSRVSSNTTVQKHQFFGTQLSL